jgi:hypothetical protein
MIDRSQSCRSLTRWRGWCRSADQAFNIRRLSRGAHDLVAHSDRSNSNSAHRGRQPAPRYSTSALLDHKLVTPENDFIVK